LATLLAVAEVPPGFASLRLDSDLQLGFPGPGELLSLLEDHYQVELDEAKTSATTQDVEDSSRPSGYRDQQNVVESTSGRAENADHETSANQGLRCVPSVRLALDKPYPTPLAARLGDGWIVALFNVSPLWRGCSAT
jgi:hypothetical protein